MPATEVKFSKIKVGPPKNSFRITLEEFYLHLSHCDSCVAQEKRHMTESIVGSHLSQITFATPILTNVTDHICHILFFTKVRAFVACIHIIWE